MFKKGYLSVVQCLSHWRKWVKIGQFWNSVADYSVVTTNCQNFKQSDPIFTSSLLEMRNLIKFEILLRVETKMGVCAENWYCCRRELICRKGRQKQNVARGPPTGKIDTITNDWQRQEEWKAQTVLRECCKFLIHNDLVISTTFNG